MRLLIRAVFIGVIVALAAGLHYYFWMRLVRDPAWPEPWTRIGTRLLVGLGILVPVALALNRVLPRWAVTPLASTAYVWMGACLYLFLLLFGADLAGWLMGLLTPSGAEPVDTERRQLVSRGAVGAVGVITAGATAASLRGGLAELEVTEVAVNLPRLPKALDGLSIVQLSDIHVGPTIGRRFMQDLVDKVNAAKPDLVAITGDLVDGSVAQLGEHTAPLSQLRSRFGSYFVTGNHEYYSGVQQWLEELERLGIRTLRNERVVIGDNGASFDLAGVDDATAHRFGRGHGADVAGAVAGRDPDRAMVLLAHQPKAITDVAEAGVCLQLSGHTHGGQLWPFNNLVNLVQPYVAGLHQHTEQTRIYVSRGCGYWGPPMRLGAPAEITKLVLTSG